MNEVPFSWNVQLTFGADPTTATTRAVYSVPPTVISQRSPSALSGVPAGSSAAVVT